MMTENLTEKPDRKNLLLKVWCVCTAFLILMLTTRSSFLFPINNWDDVNSYFSMGKGMMNGMVIYRDLYDQKGPYLYLLFGISYLISHRTFLGVFVFEVAAAAVTLYFAGKYILRYSGFKAALFMIPILGAGMYSSWSFYWGGAAEEFCLPMFAASVYFLEGILKDRYSGRELAGVTALTGIFAGVTAQVKYTMLGFYAAWFIMAVLWIAKTAGVRDTFLKGFRFILFALVPSVPWFIYFLATGSLDDWYRCYIYNNLFFYTDVSGVDSFVSKLYAIAKTLYWLIQDSFSYFIFIIPGFILQFVREKGVLRRISSLFVFALMYFVIFIGGN
ncbi:MAG: hypothetical protein K6E33_07395, partial [Lachnospiraceae bacterium]|nr:hypothetical protein [Lachnospiraceae bacterium]